MRPIPARIAEVAVRDAAGAKHSLPTNRRAEPAAPPQTLTRTERLAIWAAALERRSVLAQITKLDEAKPSAQAELRRDGSAASVAFQEPALRAAGLRGDTVGAAMEFFQLNANEVHRILCECGTVRVQTGRRAAAAVRRVARTNQRERATAQICAGVVAALGLLLGLRLLAG